MTATLVLSHGDDDVMKVAFSTPGRRDVKEDPEQTDQVRLSSLLSRFSSKAFDALTVGSFHTKQTTKDFHSATWTLQVSKY